MKEKFTGIFLFFSALALSSCSNIFHDMQDMPLASMTMNPLIEYTYPHDGMADVSTNQSLLVVFNKDMDAASLGGSPFEITDELGQTVSSEGRSCGSRYYLIEPRSDLIEGARYSVTLRNDLVDGDDKIIRQGFSWSFTTLRGTGAKDTEAPLVVHISPENKSVTTHEVERVRIYFNEDIIPQGVEMTVSCVQGTERVPIPGEAEYVARRIGNRCDRMFVFTPYGGTLPREHLYHVSISGVADLAENTWVEPYTWSFAVGSTVDTTPPEINEVVPAEASVLTNDVNMISAYFTEAIQPGAAMTICYDNGGACTPVAGSVSFDDAVKALRFVPDSGNLPWNRQYHVTISGIADLSGNPMEEREKRWSFVIGSITDTTPPEATGLSPLNGSVVNDTVTSLTAYFSENIQGGASISVCYNDGAGCTVVPGSTAYNQNDRSLRFTPAGGSLRRNRTYNMVFSGVRDYADNSMTASPPWTIVAGSRAMTLEPVRNPYHGFGTFGSSGSDVGYILRDNAGVDLMTSLGLAFNDPASNIKILSCFDPGASGPLADGKYLRIVHNGNNILNLGLTPVVQQNFSTDQGSPGPQTFYIDPPSGRLLLPRPSYWSRFETVSNITSPEIRSWSNIPISNATGVLTTDSVSSGKFTSGLYVVNHSTSKTRDGSRQIFPFGNNALNISRGTVSVWIRGYAMAKSGWGTTSATATVCPLNLANGNFQIYLKSYFWTNNLPQYNVDTENLIIRINGSTVSYTVPTQGSWYHVYAVWDSAGLAGGKRVRVFVNGDEISSTLPLPVLTNTVFNSYINVLADNDLNAVNPDITSSGQMDNMKIFLGEAIEDHTWEYRNGMGREFALHYIYGSTSNYQPDLTTSGSGVMYYYIPAGEL